ncbi:hypothetical protein GCM10025778_22060 [Paeniglutamicibacter antarcticus]|uniref:Uncharacterized protein n=1 Tax=Paeniglutamicibacter antarcticus TaxID=494023 RepID=A0ABP9TN64_9MICC
MDTMNSLGLTWSRYMHTGSGVHPVREMTPDPAGPAAHAPVGHCHCGERCESLPFGLPALAGWRQGHRGKRLHRQRCRVAPPRRAARAMCKMIPRRKDNEVPHAGRRGPFPVVFGKGFRCIWRGSKVSEM